MEKLIELLNEYGEYDLAEHNGEICKWTTDDEGEINIYTDYTNNIISKKYGFIQWLYDNDKIDMEEVADRMDSWGTDNSCDVPNILMNLAIQDEPIEFLVSILK